MQHRVAKRRRVSRNHVEGNGRHRDHQRPNDHHRPVVRQRTEYFRGCRPVLPRHKLIRLLQRPPQTYDPAA